MQAQELYGASSLDLLQEIKFREDNSPMAELTDHERGFLEAAIDGEGCIGMTKTRVRYRKPYYRSIIGYSYQVRLLVRNTNFEFCKKIFGIIRRFGSSWIRTQRWDNGKWKPCHEVGFSAQTARRILPKLDLLIKREQQELILEALRLLEENTELTGRLRTNRPMLVAALKKNYQRLDEIYKEIKALNFRGL
jgi:hypothetical protein